MKLISHSEAVPPVGLWRQEIRLPIPLAFPVPLRLYLFIKKRGDGPSDCYGGFKVKNNQVSVRCEGNLEGLSPAALYKEFQTAARRL